MLLLGHKLKFNENDKKKMIANFNPAHISLISSLSAALASAVLVLVDLVEMKLLLVAAAAAGLSISAAALALLPLLRTQCSPPLHLPPPSAPAGAPRSNLA